MDRPRSPRTRMAYSIRHQVPVRRDRPEKQQYRAYKIELRADFDQRCGYCNDHDRTFGNIRGFHIDHFAPKSLFPHLTKAYNNLVYACPLCNIAKSNKWYGVDEHNSVTGEIGFIDPCSPDLDDHLARNEVGEIIGLTPLGCSMVNDLKLGLLRHQLNWQIERIETLKDRLIPIMKEANRKGINVTRAIDLLDKLNSLFNTVRTSRDTQ